MSTFSIPISLPNLNPREAVLDSVYRLLHGLDTNDTPFFESGMHPDCSMHLGDHIIHGRENILKDNLAQIRLMNTSHMLANPRVAINTDGTEAQISARALTMHYPPAKGFDLTQTNPGKDRFLVCSYYQMELTRSGDEQGLWQVKKWVLLPSWAEGDPSVMPA